jgi:hypothetical protein
MPLERRVLAGMAMRVLVTSITRDRRAVSIYVETSINGRLGASAPLGSPNHSQGG